MKGPFRGLHARTLCHATEDFDRVKIALSTAVGSGEIAVSRTEGHHGNPILVLESHIVDDDVIRGFFERMDPKDLGEIVRSLESRLDDGCNLFIRIDKQAALGGVVILARNDDVISIRLRVRAYPAKCSVASAIIINFIDDLREPRDGISGSA